MHGKRGGTEEEQGEGERRGMRYGCHTVRGSASTELIQDGKRVRSSMLHNQIGFVQFDHEGGLA